MSTLPIRQLGDPCLRSVCRAITQADLSDSAFHKTLNSLHNTLAAFRASKGFGRGISASQIGVGLRVIALQLPARQFERLSIINPRVLETSDQKFRLWDDCFSFPDIMVAVERHTAIKLQYEDETGKQKIWDIDDASLAELLQHEIDHLDGIVALDRVIGSAGKGIVARSYYLQHRPELEAFLQEELKKD